jgi:predicted ATPase/DNA-binding SARP family transcriptional activator
MQLKTLGELHLVSSDLKRPVPLLLACYLSLEGPQERRHLAELFWPSAANGLANLSSALYRLNESSSEPVIAGNKVKVWSHLECDAQTLLTLLDKNQIEEASKLYGGRFLDGFFLDHWSNELEEWVYTTREILADRMRQGLINLAETQARKGNYKDAATHADAAFTLPGSTPLEPEQLEQLYKIMLAGNSNQVATLRKAAAEFALELKGTQQEVLAHFESQKPTSLTPPHNLPLEQTSFVGRENESAEIAKALKENCRLLTIQGIGGIGKTRLMLEVAQQQLSASHFKDGIYLAELETLTTSDHVVRHVADILHLELEGHDEVLVQLTKYIADKHLLLLLDNYEQLIHTTSILTRLLDSCSNLKLLVTSRERLNLTGEWVLALEGLPYPDIQQEQPETFAAVSLFIQRAKQSRLDFSPNQEDMHHILHICQMVGGSPLGIELAAVWVKIISVKEIAEEIQKSLSFLSSPHQNQNQRHQNIQITFEHSWKLLSDKERKTMQRLAAFRGGFRRDAAAKVAGATLPLLASLVDKSMLRVLPNGRYDRHPLLYQFTQDKLSSNPKLHKQSLEAHGQYFFDQIEKQCEALWGHGASEAMTFLDEEQGNIEAAWEWAISGPHVKELEKAQDLLLYYHRKAKFQEGATLFSKAVEKLDEKNKKYLDALGAMLVNQAWLIYQLDLDTKAKELTEKALELSTSGSKTANTTKMKAFNTLTIITKLAGDYKQARGYAKQGLDLARKVKDKKRIPVYLTSLAILEEILENYGNAEKFYLEAQGIYKERGNSYELIICLRSLGDLMLKKRTPHKALPFFTKAFELSQRNNINTAITFSLSNLSIVYFHLGDYDRAKEFASASFKHAHDFGYKNLEREALINLAKAELSLNNFNQAKDYLCENLKFYWQTRALEHVLECLIYLGEVVVKQGEIEKGYLWWQVVLNHTTKESLVHKKTLELLSSLQKQLTHEQRLTNQDKARNTTLDAIITEILWLNSTNQ